MATGFLHGTSVFTSCGRFKIIVLTSITLALLLIGTKYAYAAAWFTTYGGGVLSGGSDTDSIKTTQPYFASGLVFKSALVQPGVVTPNPTMPSFAYGGIITSEGFDVKQTNSGGTTSPTDKDAFAKNIGIIGGAFPDYQRFVDAATDPGCDHTKLLTSCNLDPGIYKASLADINTSLNDLNGQKYHVGPNTGGLFVLVQENPASIGTLNINYNVNPLPSAGLKRLVLVTNGKINIASGVGTLAVSQAGLISQDADIQAMLITTFDDGINPSIEVQSGSTKSVKIEGPIISKGKISFKRDAGASWPGVFVQYNPFYAAEFAKLDASLNIFGSSSVRWSYE